MDIEKEKSSAYGANLVWFLRELQHADKDLLSDGFIEVYGEDPAGNEGSCEVDISDLAKEAADTVEQLRAKLAAMESQEPVYFWKEIGETDWMECHKDWYLKCVDSPEHDTKLLYAKPVPADKPASARDDGYITGFNDCVDAMIATAPSHSQQSDYHDLGHEWDSQDKCKKCGDRDWYAGPVCSGKPVDSEAGTKYGFYIETYDGLPSIETLGTGDGKTLFSVLTYDDEKKTGLGLGYGRGKGVGVIVENAAQLDHHEAGVTHQIKFESVGTIDSLMFILCQIREKQEAYFADRCPSHESEQGGAV